MPVHHWLFETAGVAASEATIYSHGMLSSHYRFALALSYFTVGYNVLEGLVSIAVARLFGSPALLGFGIDSFVESLSGMVMIWRFSRANDDSPAEHHERTAIRLVGVSLILLAAYVGYDAATALWYQQPPERTIAGLVIAVVSLIVMPALYVLKRRTAGAIGSKSLAADAKQTFACILLSVALLAGAGLHYVADRWQADPAAAIVIAAWLIREGYQAWRKQELCCP